MSQQYRYGQPQQQPQNVYQQMGIQQPQPHLNHPMPVQYPPMPLKYSASNPPTSSFPNQQVPQQIQRVPQQIPQQIPSQFRPLPAPTVLPALIPPPTATPSPSRPLPTPGNRSSIISPLKSSAQNTSLSPPKRRQSPPKFISNPGSESNSPTKQSFPSNFGTKPTPTPASTTSLFASSSPPKPPTISPSPSSSSSASTSNSTPAPAKKPNPVWKRTIPEVPAPVWGYAAGLVADPHPKPSNQPPVPPPLQIRPTTGGLSGPESPTKSAGVSNKLKKKKNAKDKDRTEDEGKKVNNKTKDQISPVYGNSYGLGYSSKQRQAQYSAYQYAVGQPPQQQGPYPSSRMIGLAAIGHGSPEVEDEDEDEEEDTGTEEEEEESSEEEDTTDSAPTLSRFGNGHRRHYSQPLVDERGVNGSKVGIHRRQQGYHDSGYDFEEEEEEDEDTPKKRRSAPGGSKVPTRSVEKKIVLRPKVKVDPYGGYEDVSPIGHGARKNLRPISEIENVGRVFGMAGTSRNGRMLRRNQVESESFVLNGRRNEEAIRHAHRRTHSAIEEREMLVLNARRNRKRREAESDYGEEEEEVRLAYTTDECEEDVKVNDRRRRGEEEWLYRPQSQPNPSSRFTGGGRVPAGLPRPPAMVRDRDGGGMMSFSQAERNVRGGPRSAFVHHMSEGEAEGYHGERRGAERWPGDLPRLPRTPGTPGGGGAQRGYFDSKSDLNLDEPPPPPSIVRAPSPGVSSGYVLQRRENEIQNRSQSAGFEQVRRRVEVFDDDVHQRAHVQGRVYASRFGPSQSMPHPQVPQGQGTHGPPQLPQQGRYAATPSPRKQQQTPAPPRPVGIESPYPVGGRDRMADMNKLQPSDREPEDEEGQFRMRITDGRNVSKGGKVMGDNNDDVDPSRRDIPTRAISVQSERRPLPSPSSSPRTSRPQSMVITQSFGASPTKPSPLARVQVPIEADAREIPRPRSSSVDVKSTPNSNSKSNDVPAIQVFDVPGVYVSKPAFDDDQDGGGGGVMINVSGPEEDQNQTQPRRSAQPQPASHPTQYTTPTPSIFAGPHSHSPHVGRGAAGGGSGGNSNGSGLMCGGCHSPITHGRILNAMGLRWHPPCFKCTVCDTLLEHVSSYEHDGKSYCHLDYHETFAPRCYSCKTAIIDEQFISLDDPALGKRTYHTQHFFCSECGDPFLDPSAPLSTDANGELALSGDGEFEGFTVYKGYPYCEACHVRLRLPKCKRCKKAIRDHEEAVEALGGKWCWACFVCEGCSRPFEDPSFFQRGNHPYCENCFSIMLRNEI